MLSIYKKAIEVILIVMLCVMSYLLGKSQTETKIVKEKGEEIVKEVEVIKYVEKEKSKLWRRPNANRDTLLKLMHDNRL